MTLERRIALRFLEAVEQCSPNTHSYAWVSPNGKVIKVSDHREWADEYVEAQFDDDAAMRRAIERSDFGRMMPEASTYLLEKGWLRVTNAFVIQGKRRNSPKVWDAYMEILLDCVVKKRIDPFSPRQRIDFEHDSGYDRPTIDEFVEKFGGKRWSEELFKRLRQKAASSRFAALDLEMMTPDQIGKMANFLAGQVKSMDDRSVCYGFYTVLATPEDQKSRADKLRKALTLAYRERLIEWMEYALVKRANAGGGGTGIKKVEKGLQEFVEAIPAALAAKKLVRLTDHLPKQEYLDAKKLDPVANKILGVVWSDAKKDGVLDRSASKVAERFGPNIPLMEESGNKVKYKVKSNSQGILVAVYYGRKKIGSMDAYVTRYPETSRRCGQDVWKLLEKYPQLEDTSRDRWLPPGEEVPLTNTRALKVFGAFITDETKHGLGIGKAMYLAIMKEWYAKVGPFLFMPMECDGSGTSKMAKRVWTSLARQFPSSGEIVAVVKRPQLPADLKVASKMNLPVHYDKADQVWFIPPKSKTYDVRDQLGGRGYGFRWNPTKKRWESKKLTPKMKQDFEVKDTHMDPLAPAPERLKGWFYEEWLPKNIDRFTRVFSDYARNLQSSYKIIFSLKGGKVKVKFKRKISTASEAIEELRYRYINRQGRGPWLEVLDKFVELVKTTNVDKLIKLIDRINNLQHSNGLFMEHFPNSVQSWYMGFLNAKYHAPTGPDLAQYIPDRDLKEMLIWLTEPHRKRLKTVEQDYRGMGKDETFEQMLQKDWRSKGYPREPGTKQPDRFDPEVQKGLSTVRRYEQRRTSARIAQRFLEATT